MSMSFPIHRRSLLTAGFAVLVIAASLVASSAPAAVRQTSTAGVFRVGIPGDPSSIDPSVAGDSIAWAVLNNLSRGLVWPDPTTLKPEPSMATSWVTSNHGRTYTFKLRTAKYSDGEPIVASDFVFSWRRQLDPRVGGPDASLMSNIVGAQPLLDMANAATLPSDSAIDAALNQLGVSAPNPHTFVVRLAKPQPSLVDMATALPFAPEKPQWIASGGLTTAANDVSSGPFELVSWVPNSQLVLKPNPNWYGTKPKIKTLDMVELPDFTAALEAYQANEVDTVEVSASTVPHLSSSLQKQYKGVDVLGQGYYTYNLLQGPTKNANLRAALNEAINIKEMDQVVNAGLPKASYSWIPPGMLGYQANPNDPFKYNLADAKRHLALALKQMGLTSASQIPALNLIFIGQGDPQEIPKAAYVAQEWKTELGINTNQNGLAAQAFRTARRKMQFDVSRDAWLAPYNDTGGMMQPVFSCGGSRDFSGYCNKKVDYLFNVAAVDSDPKVRAKLYAEIQTIVLKDAVIMPQAISLDTYLLKPNVTGLIPSELDSEDYGDLDYENVSVK